MSPLTQALPNYGASMVPVANDPPTSRAQARACRGGGGQERW